MNEIKISFSGTWYKQSSSLEQSELLNALYETTSKFFKKNTKKRKIDDTMSESQSFEANIVNMLTSVEKKLISSLGLDDKIEGNQKLASDITIAKELVLSELKEIVESVLEKTHDFDLHEFVDQDFFCQYDDDTAGSFVTLFFDKLRKQVLADIDMSNQFRVQGPFASQNCMISFLRIIDENLEELSAQPTQKKQKKNKQVFLETEETSVVVTSAFAETEEISVTIEIDEEETEEISMTIESDEEELQFSYIVENKAVWKSLEKANFVDTVYDIAHAIIKQNVTKKVSPIDIRVFCTEEPAMRFDGFYYDKIEDEKTLASAQENAFQFIDTVLSRLQLDFGSKRNCGYSPLVELQTIINESMRKRRK